MTSLARIVKCIDSMYIIKITLIIISDILMQAFEKINEFQISDIKKLLI